MTGECRIIIGFRLLILDSSFDDGNGRVLTMFGATSSQTRYYPQDSRPYGQEEQDESYCRCRPRARRKVAQSQPRGADRVILLLDRILCDWDLAERGEQDQGERDDVGWWCSCEWHADDSW
jgi:hypothetical protein